MKLYCRNMYNIYSRRNKNMIYCHLYFPAHSNPHAGCLYSDQSASCMLLFVTCRPNLMLYEMHYAVYAGRRCSVQLLTFIKPHSPGSLCILRAAHAGYYTKQAEAGKELTQECKPEDLLGESLVPSCYHSLHLKMTHELKMNSLGCALQLPYTAEYVPFFHF